MLGPSLHSVAPGKACYSLCMQCTLMQRYNSEEILQWQPCFFITPDVDCDQKYFCRGFQLITILLVIALDLLEEKVV